MRFSVVLVLTALAMPALATAQHTLAKPGRVAGIAPAPPPPAPAQSSAMYPPPGQFLYGSVPVVVFPDGRVYADFGYGYEQVTRNCAAPQTTIGSAGVQPRVVQPSVVQPQPGAPVTTSATSETSGGSMTAPAGPCWSTDARGQLTVRR